MERFIRLYRRLFPKGPETIVELMTVLVDHIGSDSLDKLEDHDLVAMMFKLQALLHVGDDILTAGCSDTDRFLIDQLLKDRFAHVN